MPVNKLAQKATGAPPHNIRADKFLSIYSKVIGTDTAESILDTFKVQGLDPKKFRFRGVIPPTFELPANVIKPGFSVRRTDRLSPVSGVASGNPIYSGYPGSPGRAYDLVPIPSVGSSGSRYFTINSLRRGKETPTLDLILSDKYMQKTLQGKVVPTRDEPLDNTPKTKKAVWKTLPNRYDPDLTLYNQPFRSARLLQSKEQKLIQSKYLFGQKERGVEAVRQAPKGKTDDVGAVVFRPGYGVFGGQDDLSSLQPSLLFTATGNKSGLRTKAMPITALDERASGQFMNDNVRDLLKAIHAPKQPSVWIHPSSFKPPAPFTGDRLNTIRELIAKKGYGPKPTTANPEPRKMSLEALRQLVLNNSGPEVREWWTSLAPGYRAMLLNIAFRQYQNSLQN